MSALGGTAKIADHFGKSESAKIGALSMNPENVDSESSPQSKFPKMGAGLSKHYACEGEPLLFEGFCG